MLFVESFTFNPFSENTYIVYNDRGGAVVIDPGMFSDFECRTLDNFIAQKQLNIQAIINTHTHIDHILGVQYIKDKYKCPFYIHSDDQIILDNAVDSARRFGFELSHVPQVDAYLTDEYKIGDDVLEIFLTPGHSPGSVSFYYAPAHWVISGDALFNQSIGRTDLLMGSFEILEQSIKEKLYVLPENTIVYSGHGPQTTIGDEIKNNPFVRL